MGATSTATSHMLYLHRVTPHEGASSSASHCTSLRDADYTAIGDEEQALKTVLTYMAEHEVSVHKTVEKHLEDLQEAFFQRMTVLLREKNVTAKEKFVISLMADNTLFLQCQDSEDVLLDALGHDEELLQCLHSLRSFAYMSRALEYFSASQEEYPSPSLPQYKVCTKGLLTHFYLKSDSV